MEMLLLVPISDTSTKSYNSDNCYFVKDWFEFFNFINEFQLPPGYIIVDATALSKIISLNTALSSIIQHWNTIFSDCKLTSAQFQ